MEELDLGYQIITGTKKVLLVAGHNFKQGRIGKIKSAEFGTGKIVRNMAAKYNCFGIVSTKDQMDPNWYSESPFRQKIREIIKKEQISLIVDFHGSSMANEKLIYLRGNKKFKETYKINVLNFVENEQITLEEEWDEIVPAVEVEIREDGRISTIDEDKYTEAQKLIEDLLIKLMNEN